MKPSTRSIAVVSIVSGLLLFAGMSVRGLAPAQAQMGDPSKVKLKATPVVGTVSVIQGVNGFAGGNIAVAFGDEGAFLIDDGLAGVTAHLKAQVAALTRKPLRFVINTHWHFDHTGGNAALGAGSVIIAHENVRKRMSVDQVIEFGGKKNQFPASPPVALPVVTFANDVTLNLNGDEVHVFHVPPAHTDGDVVVHFKKANVIHTGDVFVVGYPVVDLANGGRYQGLIEAVDRILPLVDEKTKLIPGHGPVSARADLVAYRSMLVEVRDRVAKLVAAGKSLEDIKAAKPLADFDAKYGNEFIKADMVIELLVKNPGGAAPAAK